MLENRLIHLTARELRERQLKQQKERASQARLTPQNNVKSIGDVVDRQKARAVATPKVPTIQEQSKANRRQRLETGLRNRSTASENVIQQRLSDFDKSKSVTQERKPNIKSKVFEFDRTQPTQTQNLTSEQFGESSTENLVSQTPDITDFTYKETGEVDYQGFSKSLEDFLKLTEKTTQQQVDVASNEAQQEATSALPTEEELREEFFGTETGKEQEKQDETLEDQFAIEQEKLQNFYDKQIEQRKEKQRRIDLLNQGGALATGVNMKLATGIALSGDEFIRDQEEKGQLALRDLINQQDQVKLNLDSQQQLQLDRYIATRQNEVAQENKAIIQAQDKQYDRQRQATLDTLNIAKAFPDQFKIENINGEIRLVENTKRNDIASIFNRAGINFTEYEEFMRDNNIEFDRNQWSSILLTKEFSDAGLKVPTEMFGVGTSTEKKERLKMFMDIMELPQATRQALSAYNATLDVEDKIGDQVHLDNFAKVTDLEADEQLKTQDGEFFTYNKRTGILKKIQPQGQGEGAVTITAGTTNRISDVLNNPGNIKRGGIADKFAMKDENGNLILNARGEGNFLTFETPEDGYNALKADLQAKQEGRTSSGLSGQSSLLEFAQKYALSGQEYADTVARVAGVDINTPIGDIPLDAFAKGVATQEGFTGQINIGQPEESEKISTQDLGDLAATFSVSTTSGQQSIMERLDDTNQVDEFQKILQEKEFKLTGKDRVNEETRLRKEFDTTTVNQRKAIGQLEIMESSLEKAEKQMIEGKSLNSVSQGILVTFQKILDPESVVRESEYARSGEGQSLIENMEGIFVKIKQGGAGLTIESLRDFVDTAQKFTQGYKDSMIEKARVIRLNSRANGLRENLILEKEVIDLLNKSEKEQQKINIQEILQINPNVTEESINGALKALISEGKTQEEALQEIKNYLQQQ